MADPAKAVLKKIRALSSHPPPSSSLPLFLEVMLHLFCCAKLYDARVQSRCRHTQSSLLGHRPTPLVQPSCLQREASGKLISAAERGVLQQVIVILALCADVDTTNGVRAAAGVCVYFLATLCVEEVDFDGRPR